jgi:hypothetical protein
VTPRTLPPVAGESPKLFAEAPGAHVWSWRNLYVGVWSGQTTPAMVQAMLDVQAEMATRFHGDIGQISIIEATTKLPTPDTREVMTRAMKQSSTRAVAIVMSGQGFWMSAVRSVLTAVVFVVRGKVAMQFFDSEEESLRWLVGQLERPPEIEHALEAVRAMRAASREG